MVKKGRRWVGVLGAIGLGIGSLFGGNNNAHADTKQQLASVVQVSDAEAYVGAAQASYKEFNKNYELFGSWVFSNWGNRPSASEIKKQYDRYNLEGLFKEFSDKMNLMITLGQAPITEDELNAFLNNYFNEIAGLIDGEGDVGRLPQLLNKFHEILTKVEGSLKLGPEQIKIIKITLTNFNSLESAVKRIERAGLSSEAERIYGEITRIEYNVKKGLAKLTKYQKKNSSMTSFVSRISINLEELMKKAKKAHKKFGYNK